MPTTIAEKDMQNAAGTPSLEEAMQRGVAAAQRGERDEANRIFRETVETHPEAVDVWIWLGGTTPDLDEAEMAFEQARTLDPDNEKAALGLRWVQVRRNGPEAAYQPIMGAPVAAPTQSIWDQGATAQLEPAASVAEESMPAVPVATQPPAELATAVPQEAKTPQARRLSSAVLWVALAAFVILLVALGYFYFFVQ